VWGVLFGFTGAAEYVRGVADVTAFRVGDAGLLGRPGTEDHQLHA
jgi:hypothetical protein